MSLLITCIYGKELELVHQYKSNGNFIVLDVNSGTVHVVDQLAYDIIALYETCDTDTIIQKIMERVQQDQYTQQMVDIPTILEAIDEVEQKKKEGTLFSEDPYQDHIEMVQNRETVVKALCLHIAHDCNLACQYCFAQEGEYHGKRSLMSYEVGKKAIDYLLECSGKQHNLEVDFFGGEPLMNFSVVKDLVHYAREQEQKTGKKFRFTMTTNGLLLNEETRQWIQQEMDNVVLSIDGRKAIQDQMRPFPKKDGRKEIGSYDFVVPNLLAMAKLRKDQTYYARGTFTNHNLDFLEDIKHLAQLGFDRISMEPVVAPLEAEYAIREEHIDAICKEYDRLVEWLLQREEAGKPVEFFHFMLDLTGGPCVIKRLSGCGAGTQYLAVTPEGDLYPCHQFVGNPDYWMGNVTDGIQKPDLKTTFASCHVYAKEKCKNCFAKFYCSGGCAANAYQFHHTIFDVYDLGCKLQQKRVECAIALQVAKQKKSDRQQRKGVCYEREKK